MANRGLRVGAVRHPGIGWFVASPVWPVQQMDLECVGHGGRFRGADRSPIIRPSRKTLIAGESHPVQAGCVKRTRSDQPGSPKHRRCESRVESSGRVSRNDRPRAGARLPGPRGGRMAIRRHMHARVGCSARWFPQPPCSRTDLVEFRGRRRRISGRSDLPSCAAEIRRTTASPRQPHQEAMESKRRRGCRARSSSAAAEAQSVADWSISSRSGKPWQAPAELGRIDRSVTARSLKKRARSPKLLSGNKNGLPKEAI
ncbi:hypothetical protein EV278_108174 [Caulobacter sp. BK020]|nr:hypothetical protein EV278_108174 [Caulobacter sp. BK020]